MMVVINSWWDPWVCFPSQSWTSRQISTTHFWVGFLNSSFCSVSQSWTKTKRGSFRHTGKDLDPVWSASFSRGGGERDPDGSTERAVVYDILELSPTRPRQLVIFRLSCLIHSKIPGRKSQVQWENDICVHDNSSNCSVSSNLIVFFCKKYLCLYLWFPCQSASFYFGHSIHFPLSLSREYWSRHDIMGDDNCDHFISYLDLRRRQQLLHLRDFLQQRYLHIKSSSVHTTPLLPHRSNMGPKKTDPIALDLSFEFDAPRFRDFALEASMINADAWFGMYSPFTQDALFIRKRSCRHDVLAGTFRFILTSCKLSSPSLSHRHNSKQPWW